MGRMVTRRRGDVFALGRLSRFPCFLFPSIMIHMYNACRHARVFHVGIPF
jgi:hypothetical protein